MVKDEKLVICRFVYNPNIRDENGESTKEDRSDEIAKYSVGDKICHWAAAPGTGRIIYRVTREDEEGLWGVVEKDNTRILTIADVI